MSPRAQHPVIRIIASIALVFAAIAVVPLAVPESALNSAAAAPGTPGTPQAGTPFYLEDFQNQSAAAAAIPLTSYTGGAAASNQTYSADAAWLPPSNACNGYILRSTTPTAAGVCAQTGGIPPWPALQQLALFMGQYQGQATPATNQVLSEYTHGVAQSAGIELRTLSPMPAIAGHYYTTSAVFGAVNCNLGIPGILEPSLEFRLMVNGSPQVVGSGLNPCNAAGGQNYSSTIGGITYQARVATLRGTSAFRVPTTGSPTLGIQVYNATATPAGNDSAFDIPQIVDVTPQLDKSFSPASIPAGGTSTLTFTITNTTDLLAKTGWSFTDSLPAGLAVASPNGVATTCRNAANTANNAATVTAAAGSSAVSVSGSLNAGMASCTVTVDVTTKTVGTYTNNATNITASSGVNLPGSSTLTVTPVPISCTQGVVYGLDQASPWTMRAIDTATGATTHVVDFPTVSSTDGSINSLAVAPGGTAAYAIMQSANVAGGNRVDTVYRYNPTTGAVAAVGSITVPSADEHMVMGAINPVDGRYYVGVFNTTTLQFDFFAYDTATNTSLGKQFSMNFPNTTYHNGDLAFDQSGRMYAVLSAGDGTLANNRLVYLDAPLPTGGATVTPTLLTTLAPGSQAFQGIAFGADGYLYTEDATTTGFPSAKILRKIDPNTGAVVSSTNITNAGVNNQQVADLASCASPTTLTVKKDIVGRVGAADQFSLSITRTGLTQNNTGVTSGATTGLQNAAAATAGPVVGLPGVTYGIAETGSAGANLANYTTAWECRDGGGTGALVTSGTGASGSVTIPSNVGATGADIVCTFTNTPKQPGITIDKTANKTTYSAVGEQVVYTFTVTNSGDLPLTGVTVADTFQLGGAGTLTAINCQNLTLPAGACSGTTASLQPGQVATFTATYTAVQSDITGGTLRNSATAAGTPPSGTPVTSPPDLVTLTATQTPAITLDKSHAAIQDLDGNGPDAGDTVAYSFLVTNTGNVPLTTVGVSDPKIGGPISCPVTTLAPAANTTCTATYTLTQADVNAGVVNNTATATGTPPTGPNVSSTDTDTLNVPSNPAITLDKQAATPTDVNGNGRVDAGDTIGFTFIVTNTGNVTLNPVTVTDPKVGPVTCPVTQLAPGGTTTCTKSYTITQADVNTGAVNNTATATGTPPTGGNVTATDSTTTPTSTLVAITLDKSHGSITDADGNGADAGDTVVYSFLVTNTGDRPLSTVNVTDPKIGGPINCPVTTLAPGASTTCTATYTLTQADVNAGVVNNTATAHGTPPTGPEVTATDIDTLPVPRTPAISLDKQAATPTDVNGNGRVDAGDTIAFTFIVTNTGNVTLDPVTVSDPKVGPVTCAAGALAPGAQRTCTAAVYTITQADVNTGGVNNTATATGTPPSGPNVTATDSTSTPTSTDAAITLDKSHAAINDLDGNGPDAGDTVAYSFLVTNTGAVTLTTVNVTDPKIGGPINCPVTTLAPGANTTCTATYTLTQADVNAGVVNNTATAHGTPPTGPNVTATDTDTLNVPSNPAITLDKSHAAIQDVDGNGPDAGDTVGYSFLVTNTGTVALSTVNVTDPKIGGPINCPVTSLAPGANTTCTATYTLTQADVNAGVVNNTATAHGTPPTGPNVTSTDTDTLNVPSNPAISIDKSAGAPADVNGNGQTDAGDTIAFTFVVTNEGNVTLSPVSVTDPKVGPVTCPVTSLAPGASTTCTKSYTITQADVNTGSVNNTATAHGTPPTGPEVTDTDSTSTPTSNTPAITLDKSHAAIQDVDGNGPDAGDTVAYSFLVTNTGTVTLSTVNVTDPKIGGPINCPVTSLAPGANTTCTATYTLTQADVNAGVVNNTATAHGTPPTGPEVTATDTDTLNVPSNPVITLDKQAATPSDVNGNGLVDAGDTIAFTFVVTNEGNVTLNPVSVTDPKVGPVTCPVTSLAPGASTTCTKSYTITQADVNTGAVNNTATAHGTPPTGPEVTDTDSTSTPTGTTASLELEKFASAIDDVDGNGPDAGDEISYTFTVTNSGTVTVDNLVVSDDLAGAVTCDVTSLEPGESAQCEADDAYVLTQDDVDAGNVHNIATATGDDPSGDPVDSPPDSTDTPIDADPSLSIVKSADAPVDVDNNGVIDAGDTIQYRFEVTNTGNTTLTNVTVTDALAGAVSCDETTLAPGESTDCAADVPYVITQADVDAGNVHNTAFSTGTPPSDPPVDSPPDPHDTPIDPVPSMTLDKSVVDVSDENGNGLVDAGDEITWSFLVTNTGNVTIDDVAVDDPLAGPVDCPVTTLAAGENVTCTADPYVITQADVNAGNVHNVATATADDPTGDPLDPPTDTTDTPTSDEAGLELEKFASAIDDVDGNGPDAGDEISYTFTVTNSGTVTVDNLVVSDDLAGAVTCDVTSLEPGESAQCEADEAYVLTQDDVDAGNVHNIATATGDDPSGDPVDSPPDSTDTPIDAAPELSLEKSAGTPTDADGDGAVEVGDTIQYSFEVTNTGNVTVDNIEIDDQLAGTATCAPTTLAPGDVATCVADNLYAITQADVDAGNVHNTATATGDDPDGDPVESNEDETDTPIDPVPSMTLDKSVVDVSDENGNGLVDAGDEITWSFLVTNTGNVTIDDVAVDDPLAGPVDCPVTTLAAGENVTCTADPYVITQADVNAGNVHNVATATANDPTGDPLDPPTDTTDTPTSDEAGLELEKFASAIDDVDGNGPDAGDEISYTFTVTNSGTVTVDNLVVSDDLAGAVTCDVTSLEPGESAQCEADDAYVLTQDDVDAGNVHNIATATGDDPSGDPVGSPPDSTDTPIDADPSLSIVKSADAPVDVDNNGVIDAGDTIQYRFEVTNTGNTTLTNVTVTDALAGAVSCDETTLAPGESTDCAADETYVITQADVDAGNVHNTAFSTGTPPNDPPVDSPPDPHDTPIDPVPNVALEKSVDEVTDTNDNGVVDAGDEIVWTFEVTNTGNVTLTNISVDDPLAGPVSCPSGPLAPGASVTCSAAPYAITQADVNDGHVINTAIATGTPPTGPPVDSPPDSTDTPTEDNPGLELEKTAGTPTDVNANGHVDAGDTIQYSFEVTNTGTVTIDNLVVNDDLAGAVTCDVTSLDPGDVAQCEAVDVYVITQADVDAGVVHNVATASGDDPSGDPVDSPPDSTDTPTDTTASLSLDKRAGTPVDVNHNGVTDAGDTIAFTFTVTNTGSVTMSTVKVHDNMVGSVTCEATTLAPGESTECAADKPYRITQAQADEGTVHNVATSTGEPSVCVAAPKAGAKKCPTVKSNEDETETPTGKKPGMELVKRVGSVTDVNGNDRTDAGDTVVYEFEVTNTGTTRLTDVGVDDPMLTGAGVDVSCPKQTLRPGQSMVCESDPYTITDADVEAGGVHNVATATAQTPDGDPLGSGESTADVSTDRLNGWLPNTGAGFSWWMPLAGLGLLGIGFGLILARPGNGRRRHA